jgi:hypothetical protein
VLLKTGFLIVPFALLMVVESLTGRNPFAALGAVYAESWTRDGYVRSAGAFRNAITAGSFGATLAILFAGSLPAYRPKSPMVVGLLSCIATVVCARSSGPLLGLILGCVALACWYMRERTRAIRWAIAAGLTALALVMNAPVWFVIDRVSDITGGGGYHRALLIDRFINDFSAWWLAGTTNTSHWFPYTLADGTRFIRDAVDAGLIGLVLSCALVVRCYQRLGEGMKSGRELDAIATRSLWGLGAALTASVGILFSVTYFDQMFVMWHFVVACIASLPSDTCAAAVIAQAPSPALDNPVQRWVQLGTSAKLPSPSSRSAPLISGRVPH